MDDAESFQAALDVIRKSFQTVADEFELTPQNAPTDRAFLTMDSFHNQYAKGVSCYCLFDDCDGQIGFMALEKTQRGRVGPKSQSARVLCPCPP